MDKSRQGYYERGDEQMILRHYQKGWKGITHLINQAKQPFETDKVLDNMTVIKTGEKTREQVLSEWKEKARRTRDRGIAIHEIVCNNVLRYRRGLPSLKSNNPLFAQFNDFWQTMRQNGKWLAYAELKVGDQDRKLQGSIDLLMFNANTGDMHIIDIKAIDNIPSSSDYGKSMQIPFRDLDDCKMNH